MFYDGGVTPDNNACSGGVATFFISSLNFGDHGKTAENEQTIFLSYHFPLDIYSFDISVKGKALK